MIWPRLPEMSEGYGFPVTRTDPDQSPARSSDDADVDADIAAFDPTSSEPLVGTPIEGAPSDNTTMTEVLNGLRELGFTASFTSQDDALLHCDHCGVTSAAASFDVVDTRHLEGASDPDDLVTLVAARCPSCGSGGNVVLGYGVNATSQDADISAALFRTDHAAPDV